MNDINLVTYRNDEMNIQDMMSHTKMGNLELKTLYNNLKNKFQLNMKNTTKKRIHI